MEEFINRAEGFIAEKLCEEFSLDEIAEHCGYSSFHFARKFKKVTGKTVMEYVREKRIFASAEMIKRGSGICNAAMEFCFETHSGFTRAFASVFGCCPREYAAHCSGKNWKGYDHMNGENPEIIIRSVRLDDLNDLWENVYSAMTPKEITEVKIIPSMERGKRQTGVEVAGSVDGTVVMTLPMIKPFWMPMGFLFDNDYVITGDGRDEVMKGLLEEMKIRCRAMGIFTLISPQKAGSGSIGAFAALGFGEVWNDGEWVYLAMSV